ncbi:MAG: GMC family oxidoreductase N-terminal domain-containing protein, partial [Desulfobacterales bacterium]
MKKRDWMSASEWPIGYPELLGYCEKASQLLGLPSFEKFSPYFWQKELSGAESALFQNEWLKPNISMWAKKPLRFGKAYYAKLKKSRNVRVILRLNATEIQLAAGGTAVESVNAATLDGKKVSIKAKKYVFACGGLENARLLLVSRGQHPQGVGNHYDLVGRYYMDHPRAVFGRVILSHRFDLSRLIGLPLKDGKAQMGLALSEKIQKEEELLNNYLSLETNFSELTQEAYHSFVKLMKRSLRKGYAGKRFDFWESKIADIPNLIYLLAPREIMPHFLYRCYSALRKKQKKELIVVNYCEQEPNAESRVTLSMQRDKLGMNLLTLNWKVGRKEMSSLIRLQELLGALLKEKGLGYLQNNSLDENELKFSDASHHIGTTRMSEDPKKGVVDKN